MPPPLLLPRGQVKATVGGHRTTGAERATLPARGGGCGMAGHGQQMAAHRDIRHGRQQAARIGMPGFGEKGMAGRRLHHPAGIQHDQTVDQIAHNAEIMGHIQRPRPLSAAEMAHGFQHLGLGHHIQRRRRLVQDNKPGPQQESQRQQNTLLLAAGKLMREALTKGGVGGQTDIGHDRRHTLRPLGGCHAGRMHLQYFIQMGANAQHGVQRGARVLRHMRHPGPAQVPQGRCIGGQDVQIVQDHPPARDLRPFAGMAQQGGGNCAFARSAFSDQSHNLHRAQAEADIADDIGAPARQGNPQPLHPQQRCRGRNNGEFSGEFSRHWFSPRLLHRSGHSGAKCLRPPNWRPARTARSGPRVPGLPRAAAPDRPGSH